jgi:hypothetical protein
MVRGSEWLLEMRRAVFADRQQAICNARALFLPNAIEPLTDRDGHGGRHALARQCCQFFRQPMCFLILDVKAHAPPFWSSVYLSTQLFKVIYQYRGRLQPAKRPPNRAFCQKKAKNLNASSLAPAAAPRMRRCRLAPAAAVAAVDS